MPQDRPKIRLGHDEGEARRILSRVAQEADSGTMAAPDGRDAGQDDWVEIWGTRIGRVLGPVLLLLCAVWLLFHLAGSG